MAGFFVEALGVTVLAYFERRVNEHLDEVFFTNEFSGHLPLCSEWADEGCHDNQSGIHHQFGDFCRPADIFHAVGVGESEVFVQTLADIVSIKNVGSLALRMQFLFQCVGNRGLARP